ncbi:MFS transporter [Paramicrobacterium agarici]|uniref:MFS transporter n=1 Tax=Paramicrobacterium agarici TaxID=630514 RepID=UPI001172B1FC|nr:MFS transporter [Microbacterium agarici]TQO22840.1 putative MFS family arabinose efflux permease [Microbacterium agarici]
MTERKPSVWTLPGMPPLLLTTALAFSGFSLLMPVAPLWATMGGADSFGSGLVNGLLMLSTVATQMLVAPGLRVLGWSRMLVIGLLCLGPPSAVHLLSDQLPLILALAVVRGIGFGIITVCGSSAVAALVEPKRRGRAIGAYGLAIAVPQFVLIPAAPWLAENVSPAVVFLLGLAPIVALPFAVVLGRRLATVPAPKTSPIDVAPQGSRIAAVRTRAVVMPIVALLTITCTGGAVLTFAPTMLTSTSTAVVALLALTGLGALSRWIFGGIADRFGARRFIAPLLVVAALGAGGVAWGVAGPADAVAATLLLAGAAFIGTAYGGLQNVTLVEAFAAAGDRARNVVSVVWNAGFDLGTGLGSVVVGTIATASSFPASFAVLAAVSVAVAVLVATLRPRHP